MIKNKYNTPSSSDENSCDRDVYKQHFDKGQKLMALNKYEEALTELDLSLRINPYNYTCYSYRAVTNFQLKKYEAALKDFSELAGVKKFKAYSLFSKGNIYYELDRFEEALYMYNQVRDLGKREEKLFLYSGKTLFHLYRYNVAIHVLQTAVSMNRNSADSYWYLARCYKKLDQFGDYELMLQLGMEVGYNNFYSQGMYWLTFMKKGVN
jgi:tetratricopeptide (TPR) repeat protein